MGREQTKRWLKVLNDYWLGSNRKLLCGDQITIAGYFGACLVVLDETIKADTRPILMSRHGSTKWRGRPHGRK
jgi:hypothetical protein